MEGVEQVGRPESIKAQVAFTGDDRARKTGRPMRFSKTATAEKTSRCESTKHVHKGGCDDPVRSVYFNGSLSISGIRNDKRDAQKSEGEVVRLDAW